MSQDIFSNINPAVTSGTQLATLLNGFKDAVASGMSGTSRPSNLQAGGAWIDITNAGSPDFYWSYKVYDGTGDIEVFRVNLATSKASISGADSTFEIARISADSVGPIAKLVKQRIASNGQVLSGDIVGQVQVVGRTDTSTNPVVANLKIVATENETTSASGVYIAIEQTKSTTSSAVEVARLLDGKFGIGTTAPDVALHVKSSTGVKSEQSVDDANAALLLVEKSRVSGSGAVQSSDALGEVRVRAKDSSSAVSDVAKIKVTATEGHTSSAKGSRMVIQTIDATTSTLSDKITIDEKVTVTPALKQTASELVAQSVATTASITQLDASKAVVEFTGSTATSLKGINSGHISKVILLHNRSTADVKLEHEDASATAADRLKLPNSTFVTLRAQSSIEVYYCVADSRWKLKSGSGTGSGSGGGGSKNYLGTVNNINGNGDFELSATTGWSLGVTGTLSNGLPTTTPTFGSGASGNLSISAVTSGQLAGSASLSYSSSAATTAGNMLASDAFTIDIADQAKVMTVKFSYKAQTNPTNANWSGTSSNSFAWAIYDVTNSTWIIPTGGFGMTQSSGVGVCTGTFQTSSNGTQYRIVVYNANATSGAVTLYFDDFSVGPQTVAIGTIITDWMPYTPTISGFGTPSGVSFYSRRVGDSLEVQGTFTSGTSTGTVAQITYGYNGANANVTAASTSKITSGGYVAGVGFFSVANAVSIVMLPVPNQNYVQMGVQTTTTAGYAGVNGNQIASSGQTLSFFYRVPIAGWASNVQVSSETDTRVVAARYKVSGAKSSSTTTPINFDTMEFDTHGSVTTSPTAWKFTAPVTGFYHIGVSLDVGAGTDARIYKNGTSLALISALGVGNFNGLGSTTISLVAGDYIDIRTDGGVTSTASGADNYISVHRLSGPSVIAASETVSCRYVETATSVGTSATTVVYSTRAYDSHSAYNTSTGVFTVPVSGVYRTYMKIASGAQTVATNAAAIQLSIRKNSTIQDLIQMIGTGGTNVNYNLQIVSEFYAVAGDTIDARALFGTSSTPPSSATQNVLNITRVGN